MATGYRHLSTEWSRRGRRVAMASAILLLASATGIAVTALVRVRSAGLAASLLASAGASAIALLAYGVIWHSWSEAADRWRAGLRAGDAVSLVLVSVRVVRGLAMVALGGGLFLAAALLVADVRTALLLGIWGCPALVLACIAVGLFTLALLLPRHAVPWATGFDSQAVRHRPALRPKRPTGRG